MVNPESSGFRASVREDLRRVGSGATGPLAFLGALALRPGFLAIFLHRLAALCVAGGAPGRAVARVLARLNTFLNGCDIHPRAVIGPGCKFSHPCGVVIGPARIGRHVMILHNVTLGLRRFTDDEQDSSRYPVVGDNVILCAGAVLAGPVRVGDGAEIGANAVVLEDVPASFVAVGVPARSSPRRSAGA